MPRVVSIIPGDKNNDRVHLTRGTQVLLDDGSYLQGVHKITLVAECDDVWKAVIEVYPSNTKQIDALLQDIKVNETSKATD